MSIADLQFLLPAISAIGAAGGLFYLLMEFRGWRTAQHVANFTRLVELKLQLRRMQIPLGRDSLRLIPSRG